MPVQKNTLRSGELAGVVAGFSKLLSSWEIAGPRPIFSRRQSLLRVRQGEERSDGLRLQWPGTDCLKPFTRERQEVGL